MSLHYGSRIRVRDGYGLPPTVDESIGLFQLISLMYQLIP
jgi:hypothetical protein